MVVGLESALVEGALLASDSTFVGIPLESDDTVEILFNTALGFLFGLYLIYKGTHRYRKYALIRNTPTEEIRSVALGRTELEGTARGGGAHVDAPFDASNCLYAEWEIEEYKRKVNDDTKSWYSVDSGTLTVPFVLEGENGSVVVDPPTDATTHFSDEYTSRTQIGNNAWPGDEIGNFCEQNGLSPNADHKRRYTQTVLPPETDAYVFGEATAREDPTPDGEGERIVMERDESSGRFILSDKGENRLVSYFRRRSILKIAGGLALSTVCLAIWLYFATNEGWGFSLTGTIGVTVVTLVLYGVVYLIRKRQ